MLTDTLFLISRACILIQGLFNAFRELTLDYRMPDPTLPPHQIVTSINQRLQIDNFFFPGRVFGVPSHFWDPQNQLQFLRMLMAGACDVAMATMYKLVRQQFLHEMSCIVDEIWEVRVWRGPYWHWLYKLKIGDQELAFDITGRQHNNFVALRPWIEYINMYRPTRVDQKLSLGHVRMQYLHQAWVAQSNDPHVDQNQRPWNAKRLQQVLQSQDLEAIVNLYLNEHRLTLHTLVSLSDDQYTHHLGELWAFVRQQLATRRRDLGFGIYNYEPRNCRIE